MTPLSVALVHRASQRAYDRMVGWWSYDVPYFTVTHYPASRKKTFNLDKNELARKHDFIFYEDGKISGTFTGNAKIPVVYQVVDSTLSEDHYKHRLAQGKQADMILVDWDNLNRFTPLGKPVYRFSYCVNDKLFYPRQGERLIDIGSFQSYTEERAQLEDFLESFCLKNGYTFANGIREGKAYAEAMASSKIVINYNRTPDTRGHRCFDAMASGSCLLTSPLHDISGEPRKAGDHYVEFSSYTELAELLKFFLVTGWWKRTGESGLALIRKYHTWEIRARQLYDIVTENFF